MWECTTDGGHESERALQQCAHTQHTLAHKHAQAHAHSHAHIYTRTLIRAIHRHTHLSAHTGHIFTRTYSPTTRTLPQCTYSHGCVPPDLTHAHTPTNVHTKKCADRVTHARIYSWPFVSVSFALRTADWKYSENKSQKVPISKT